MKPQPPPSEKAGQTPDQNDAIDDSSRKMADGLSLDSVYPELLPIFSFAPAEIDIKKSAVVVLDTNVLLVPYTASSSSLQAIRTTYAQLIKEDRLVVPGQVAREYAKHRPDHLAAIYDQITKRRHGVQTPSASDYPLLAELQEYKTLVKAEETLRQGATAYRDAADALLKVISGWTIDDPVRKMYRELFRTEVFVDMNVEPGALKDDLQRRATYQIPPGYADGRKPVNAAGDLLIWKTILQVAKDKPTDIIFVSGEKKADWWHRAGNMPLYPRVELLDEFRRVSGHSLGIIQLADLLKQFGATAEVVDDIRIQETLTAEIVAPEHSGPGFTALAMAAFSDWAVINKVAVSEIGAHVPGHGFTVESIQRGGIAFRIHATTHPHVSRQQCTRMLEEWRVSRSNSAETGLALVCSSLSSAENAYSSMMDLVPELMSSGSFVVGFVRGQQFQAVHYGRLGSPSSRATDS